MRRLATVWAVALAIVSCGGVLANAEELKVGQKAPDFKATTVDGKQIELSDTKGGEATVICFTSHECPVAIAYEKRFKEFVKKYEPKGVKFVALNCNTRTEDLQEMKTYAEEKGFNFPYAFDKSGDSAGAYNAKVTPHLYVLDENGTVVYIGSFDDHMNEEKASKDYVVNAVDAVLKGEKPEVTQTKAFGCSIKQ